MSAALEQVTYTPVVSVTAFVPTYSFTLLFGGTSQPGWLEASDKKMARSVNEELDSLLGIKGRAVEIVINRWPLAIPQYSTALPAVGQTARETWCAEPGRALFGNYTGQVSLRGMIETAAAMEVRKPTPARSRSRYLRPVTFSFASALSFYKLAEPRRAGSG